jgi:uncharacterized phage-associated protein
MRTADRSLPDAVDVAASIIQSAHDVDQMKLQKLLYYAQAWYLAWYGEPLFWGQIEAWQHGPYVPRVGRLYGGEGGYGREIIRAPVAGDPSVLDEIRQMALASVIQAYDELTGTELADLTKTEDPWHQARGDRPEDDSSGRDEITRESLRQYFRKEAKFGPRPPDVRISEQTLERVRAGDPDAVIDGLKEALRA